MTPDVVRGEVDLLVGLATPALQGPHAAALVRDVSVSLAAYSSSLRWRLVVPDSGGSADLITALKAAAGANGNLAAVPYTLQPNDALDLPYHGVPGRARILRAILEEAHAQRARSCVIVDPRAGSPSPWLASLAEPLVTDTLDYVAPLYTRHPFTGALVHGLLYPAFRALYGARLRFPIGGDFGFSSRLVEAVLPDPIWETSGGQLGIDLWLSTTAVSNGLRVGQAFLGSRVEERATLDLSTTLSQLVGYFFADMERRVTFWQRVRGSRPLHQLGFAPPIPPPPDLDIAAVADSFRLGTRELQDVWAEVMPPVSILQWRRLAATPLDAFRLNDGLWARTVYDFAVGYRQRVIAREHLLRALTPLYLGWFSSFVLELREAPPEEAEARIEQLCLAFEAEKPYLISQWRWPERFKPMKMRRTTPPPTSVSS